MKSWILTWTKPTWDRYYSCLEMRGEDDCWPWHGPINNGVPSFHYKGKTVNAAKLTSAIVKDSRTSVRTILQCVDEPRCTLQRLCVNPEHKIKMGTIQSNRKRGRRKKRSRLKGRSHCIRGHDLDRFLGYKKSGRNRNGQQKWAYYCKECHRETMRRQHQNPEIRERRQRSQIASYKNKRERWPDEARAYLAAVLGKPVE